MESINTIELNNPDIIPDENVLKQVLGKSYLAYASILELFNQNSMTYEWRYYKDGKAWLCKVQHKKRTIVWMSAWKGFIKATIYFPEKYVTDIYGLNISQETKNSILNTKNVGKSKPCIFEIHTKSILQDFSVVMLFKLIAK